MTITIDATAGGAAANSYVTEAEQIAYMATRLNASTWTTLTGSTCTETEKAAMLEATRELSALEWTGRRSTTTQTLAWPRWYVCNPDSPVGFYYDSSIVPDRVKSAACEWAFQFLKAGTTDIAALDTNVGVIEKVVGPLTTRWSDHTRPQGLARFPSVRRFIAPLLVTQGPYQSTLVRG